MHVRFFSIFILFSVVQVRPTAAQRLQDPYPGGTAQVATLEQESEAEWQYILRTLRQYRNNNITNPNASIFAQQIYNVALISYRNRSEVGGWAGSLVRGNLRFSAEDIAANYARWSGPPTGEYRMLLTRCVELNGREILGRTLLDALFEGSGSTIPGSVALAQGAAFNCGAIAKGSQHIDVHVSPYVGRYFTFLIVHAIQLPQQRRIVVLSRSLEGACREHDAFLTQAVAPSFQQISDIPELFRSIVASRVQHDATEIRVNAILRALQDGVRHGNLTPDEYDIVTRSINC